MRVTARYRNIVLFKLAFVVLCVLCRHEMVTGEWKEVTKNGSQENVRTASVERDHNNEIDHENMQNQLDGGEKEEEKDEREDEKEMDMASKPSSPLPVPLLNSCESHGSLVPILLAAPDTNYYLPATPIPNHTLSATPIPLPTPIPPLPC